MAVEKPIVDMLLHAGAAPGPRIERLELCGHAFWVKRVERPRGVARLRPFRPMAAFRREVAALRLFNRVNAPAPELICAGPDFMVVRDTGQTVATLIDREGVDPHPVLEAAGGGLAGLHAVGLTHGRPKLRDMTWDGKSLRFIDLEECRPAATPLLRARDLLIFHHSLLRQAGGPSPVVEHALAAFVRADRGDAWGVAAELCRRNRWIFRLTSPFHGRGRRSNDLWPLGWIADRMAGPRPG